MTWGFLRTYLRRPVQDKDQDALIRASDPFSKNDSGYHHRSRALMGDTAIQFLERWRETNVYAEPRALEQLGETVAQCTSDAAAAGISADDLEQAAGGSLKEYLRAAIIDTSE
jgi:hypothetical protein